MKYGILKILLVLSLVGTVFAGATIFYFTARSEGGNVILEWKTENETNVKHFLIQRQSGNSPFIDIATVSPNSTKYYSYTDESAYKGQDLIFKYKLITVDYNNKEDGDMTVTVSHNISGVKRTWGSIKAMFR